MIEFREESLLSFFEDSYSYKNIPTLETRERKIGFVFFFFNASWKQNPAKGWASNKINKKGLKVNIEWVCRIFLWQRKADQSFRGVNYYWRQATTCLNPLFWGWNFRRACFLDKNEFLRRVDGSDVCTSVSQKIRTFFRHFQKPIQLIETSIGLTLSLKGRKVRIGLD